MFLQVANLERQILRNSNNAASALEELRKMSSRQEEWQRKFADMEQINVGLTVRHDDYSLMIHN